MDQIAGVLGLALLSLSWLHEAYSTVKAGYAKVPLEFALLYFAASLLLAYHAYTLDDTIFLILNAITTLMALLNILYIVSGKKKIVKKK
ncbi:MAG: hypothetical protein ACP5N9_06255 [Candidatus Bilamarchaeum sp.]|jgi:lipid-A-disaccharide synthase-like uncharacterized protein